MRSTASRVGSSFIYVMLNPWVAVVCTVVFWVGFSLSLGLAITVIGGALTLAGTFITCNAIGRFERFRAATFLGVSVPAPSRSRKPHRFGAVGRAVSDRSSWKAFAYCGLQPIVGSLTFTLTIAAWCSGLVLAFLPLYRWLLPRNTVAFFEIRTGFQTLVAAVIGVLVLFVAPFVTLLAGLVDLALVRSLLGPSREVELEEQVTQVTAQVTEVKAQRSAALDAAEAERRRIERDLHDGAQQRLVALGMTLGLAREKLDSKPDEARALLDEAHAEAKSAMTELRAIARGIHPAVLDDRGLDAALSAVAARCPFPVEISVRLPRRLGTQVEGTAYYVVSEALTNATKHAGATEASVDVWITEIDGQETMIASVVDNGEGGAELSHDGGLAGLRDRVAAIGGRFTVTSPAGGPTILTAEVPL